MTSEDEKRIRARYYSDPGFYEEIKEKASKIKEKLDVDQVSIELALFGAARLISVGDESKLLPPNGEK